MYLQINIRERMLNINKEIWESSIKRKCEKVSAVDTKRASVYYKSLLRNIHVVLLWTVYRATYTFCENITVNRKHRSYKYYVTVVILYLQY